MNDKINKKQEHNDKKGSCPFFSIVIPVWNREDCIKRCLHSVFNQDFGDYEIIAVDDGSKDNSVALMKDFNDPRLKIIQHKENRGVCAARNTGTSAALGKWIVSLDTDWVLLPGALKFLAAMTDRAPHDVGVIGGCARNDKGEIWPEKLPPPGPFGFTEYLKWIDNGGATDYQPCRRREVFETVQWPTDRRLETQFHLRVAKAWKMLIYHEIIAIAYTDSPNRWTTDRSEKGIERKLTMAPYLAQDSEEILVNFSDELKRYAPRKYWYTLANASLYNFQAGNRVKGTKFALRAFFRKPWAVQIWALLVLGLMGPRALIRIRQIGWARGLFNKLNRLISWQ